MNKYLSATALVCLFATTPALAQTATGTGVGVSNSESNSAAGAVAVNRGNGGNSSLTINNPANTTATVNSNVSGTTTQNVNSHVSGTQTLKNVPSMVAPSLAAAGIETCLGSVSGGGSVVGFGATFGTTVPDPGCQARLDARTLWSMGLKSAAVARLCIREDIYRSMPDVCARYMPVVVTPVGNPPLVAPRPINAPNYGYEQPYAMGGSSIEVIDGKTGITRACNDYNAVRQKCLNWADGPTKLAHAKPKKSAVVVTAVKPAPATAAGNSVTASALTPKKED